MAGPKRELTAPLGEAVEISSGPKEPEPKIIRVDAGKDGRKLFSRFAREDPLYAIDIDIEDPITGDVFQVEFVYRPLSMAQMQAMRKNRDLTPEEAARVAVGDLDEELWAKAEAPVLDKAIQNWTMVAKDPKDCDIEGGEFPVKLLTMQASQILSEVVNPTGGRGRRGPFSEYIRTHRRKVREGVRPTAE